MSHSYVCSTCRLHLLLRRQSQILYRQRKWLSQTTRKPQDPIERVLAGKGSSSYDARARQSPGIQDERPRGRYSGQPLVPQQLLDQLDDTADTVTELKRRGSTRGPGTRGDPDKNDSRLLSKDLQYKDSAESASRPPAILPHLWEQYQNFLHVTKPLNGIQTNDREAVEILLKIAQCRRGIDARTTLAHFATFKKRCYFLLKRICDNWRKAIAVDRSLAQRSVRPVEALAAITACYNDDHELYPMTLWPVVAALAELRAKEPEGYVERLSNGIEELMKLWNLSMRMQVSRSVDLPPTMQMLRSWAFLPDEATFADYLQHERREHERSLGRNNRFSISMALHALLPNVGLTAARAAALHSSGHEISDYPSAALVTLDLLQQWNLDPAGPKATEEYQPWVRLVENIFRIVDDTRVPFALEQKLKSPGMGDYYRDLVQRFGLRYSEPGNFDAPMRASLAVEETGEAQDVKANPSFANDTGMGKDETTNPLIRRTSQEVALPPLHEMQNSFVDRADTNRFVGTCLKRLGRALEQKDLKAAQRVYGEVKGFLSKDSPSKLPMELYASLLYSFTSLSAPRQTASIWSDMIRSGHQPTSKTYTIMMRGSQNARNNDALEGYWNTMRESGLKPDRHAWTTRIYGLLKSRTHVDVGLNAISEMGQEWIAAATAAYGKQTQLKGKKKSKDADSVPLTELLSRFEGDVNDTPRPDVVVMNSAVSALAAREDDLIGKVLTWGRSFGIEPDLTTYNALINISMRRGMPLEALNILRRMQEKGVDTNSTTWTVLLTAMFEGGVLDDLGSEEVEDRILKFLASIDDMPGSGLDEKGYALMIDRLLKVYSNPSAAQKVLERMSRRGMKPNTHLYTILMSSYFQQSPPNIAAVEGLWNQMQSENAGYGAVLDDVFYDRMIEFYARYHNSVGTKSMLDFLARMEARGMWPSWRALELAIRALAEAGEWDRLEQIVNKARRERHGGPGQEKDFGQRDFWNFVKSVDLDGRRQSRVLHEAGT